MIASFFLLKTNYSLSSYRKASTGFLVAAFQLWQLIFSKAIDNTSSPANAKIHQLKLVL